MADKRFQLTFDVNANINPIKGAIGELKGSLGNLKIPDTFKKSIESTVASLEKEITNFESIASKGFSNMGDFNKANRSFEKISDLFNKLGVQVKNLKGVDPNKFLPAETLKKTQSLQQAWLKLKQTIDKGTGNNAAIEKQNKVLAEQEQKVKDLEASYEKLKQENISMGSSKGSLTNSLKADKEAADELVRKMKELEGIKGGKSSAEYKQLSSELSQLNGTIERTQKQYDNLDAKINKNKASMSGLKTEIDAAKDRFNSITEEVKKLTEAASRTPEELTELRQKLAELKGVNIDEIPEDIDKLGEEISSLNASQLEQIKNSFQGLDAPVQKGSEAVKDFGEKVHETGDAVSYATERTRELENVANQVKQFFSIGNTVQLFKRAIRSAFDTIKELDAVMTQTAVVTDFTVGDMWAQLPEYTKRANELGVSVKGAYEAATLYYQQGLSTNEVIGVSNETLKMAKIAAIDYATATDYMTSALRGFNMEVNEQSAQKVNDIYSQLAAKTAADTEEISIAMSKTAPLAHNAGMEIETTAAFLAQAIETTREAPETIGTAMKTVIARFQELKKDPALIEPVEGEIVDANKIEGALRSIGVALRDTSGQFRDLDDVFLEISQKWNSLDTNTQRYIATIAAGSRQQSRFIAMMANYDRTMELVEMANTSAGASQQQFEKTLDSMQSKLDRLKNAWNEFTMGLANNSVIKAVVDLLTDLLNTINKISSGVSGNNGILKSLVDIGILMGGLKLGRAAFSGFFKWLQGKGKIEGQKTGQNLSKGLLSSFLSKDNNLEASLSKFRGKIYSINNILNERKIGYLTNKETFTQLFPVIDKLKTSFKNLKTTATEAGKGIISIFKAIPLQAYAIAGGIAAAVAVLALFIKGLKDSSIEGRLKQAKESTEKAEEAANQAKEAYDNLLEGKSQYSQLQETLDNLTYGTQAWKEALIEANGQVLQLLQTFPQLAQYITSGTNGRLEISSEGWDAVIEQQQDAIRRTTNNLLGAQIYQANLENEKLYKDLQKSTNIQRKGLLNELISQYENNAAFFTKDKEGNYSKELQQVANTWGINPEKIYEAQNAIREYEVAIQQNGAVIGSYTDSLISNNAKIDGLSSDFAESIKAAYNKTIGENYNNRFEEELSKLRGSKDVASNLNSILDEYGLNVTGTTKKKLQELYKYLANITGEEIDEGILDSKSAMQEAIVRMRLGDEIQSGFEQIAEMIETDTSGGIQKVLDVLSGNFEKFSSAELEELGELANKDIKDFADAMGLTEDEFKEILNSIGYSFEDFKTEFADAANEMAEQIKQSKINLVQAMIDNGAFKDSRVLMASLAGLTDQQITAMSGIANQISGLGNNTQASILKSLPGLFRIDEESITNLFKGLDFSDPISALNTLQEEAENSTTAIGKMAQQIIDMEPKLFGAGNLFKDFMHSADFENLTDDVQDFVKANGKISASNIKELANQSNKLNNLLKTGTVTAGGLAKALTAISAANVPIESFTTRVLEALSATTDFEDKLVEVQERWDNFDPGMDEGSFLDKLTNPLKGMQGITEKYQYWNTSLYGYIEKVFGPEVKEQILGLSTDAEVKAAVDSKISELESWTTGDGLGFFKDMAETYGKDLGIVLDNEGNAVIDLMGRTTDELIADWSSITKLPEDTIASFFALFSAHSRTFSKELATNNFKGKLNKLFEIDGDELAIMNESELKAFAISTGEELEKLRGEAEKAGFKIVDFIDEETGVNELGDNLIKSIERQFSKENKKFNFSDFVNNDLKIDYNFVDGQALIDIDTFKSRLEEIGLTAEQIASIDFTNWLSAGLTTDDLNGVQQQLETVFSKEYTVPVKVTDENGNDHVEMEVRIATGTSEEALNSQIDAELEAAKYNLVAESIVKQDFSGLETNITTALNNATDAAVKKMSGALNSVKIRAKDATVNVWYREHNKPKAIDSDLAQGNASATVEWQHTGGSGRYTAAEGTSGLPRTADVLTGEEGYELAYDDKGAFILGINGPEMAHLKKGTVIYPHDVSKKILKGQSKTRFSNYAGGTQNVGSFWAPEQKAAVNISVNTSNLAGSFDSLASSMKETAEAAEEVTEETEKWENEVDWLYNMTQQINHELRIRNKLEREYNRALKTNTGTGEDLRRLTNQEIVSLKKRQDMQKEMIELRKKELHTYMMLNKEMMKYAIIDNWDDMTIHIAWDSINNITDKDEYDRAIAFKDKLEDFQKQVYDLEDDVEDIEDEILELQERGKEEYRDLEDRVLAALISEQQEMIDKEEEAIKAIGNAEKDLVDAIQKNIDKMRQDRDNEEKESSLAEKERRLAYLRQDTTGSNALEIKQLEKELEKEKQDYTDTLIDQAIKDMKEQADEASKQREQQIELLQQQLDWQEKTGYWADEATRIVREGIGNQGIMNENSRLYQLLYNQEGVETMSNASRDWWKDELQATIKEAYIYLANVLEPQNNGSDVIESMKQNSKNWMTASSSGEQSNLHAENERLAKEYEAATGEKLTYNSSEGAWYKENGQRLYTISKDEIAHDVVAKMRQNSNAWGSASESKQKELATENVELAERLENVLGQDIVKKDGVWYIGTRKLYDVYKHGGLADFTGPAWLDGTKSKPEMVLNAKDTENFIQLKDILSNLRSGIVGRNTQGGDWYFDIDINVGEIANDYDVDKVAAKVKQSIYEETSYRNVNAINFLK